MIAKYSQFFLLALALPLPALSETLCNNKLLSPSQQIICENPELKDLDIKLNELYATAYPIDSDSQGLKQTQLHWLRHTRDKCDSFQCLYEAYENRIFFLSQRIEANKKLNDAPLTKADVSKVCHEIATLASNKILRHYQIVGIDAKTVRNSINGIWGAVKDMEKAGSWLGLDDIQEIYNIKVSNDARARKFVRYFSGGSCPSEKIYPLDYLTKHDRDYSGRIAVDDPEDKLQSVNVGSVEFPIYYQERNYIVTGNANGPEVISFIRPDGQILPLCLLNLASTELIAKTKEKDMHKALCAGIASGAIKPQPSQNKYTAAQAEETPLAAMSELRGKYDINLFLVPTATQESQSQSFVKFTQDSGAGCGSHNEWLRRTLVENNTAKIRFDDKALANKSAERADVYLHNNQYYVGYFSKHESALYQLTDDTLSKACEFESIPKFNVNKIF